MNHSEETTHIKNTFGLNVGSASILMTFVILCLVCFATLSLISARADSNLTGKVLTRTTEYYAARNEAEELLRLLDDELWEIYCSSASAQDYFAAVGETRVFSCKINDLQELQVIVRIQYPISDTDTLYQVTSCQIVNSGAG